MSARAVEVPTGVAADGHEEVLAVGDAERPVGLTPAAGSGVSDRRSDQWHARHNEKQAAQQSSTNCSEG